jgi:hypothetical protein
MKPEFLTNRGDSERVADGIRSYLGQLRETLANPYQLDIATAYFNLGGYMLLASELDHPSQIRILLGAEPPEPEQRIRRLGEPRTERQQLRRALEVHERELRLDSDLLGFTFENAAGSDRLIDWLRSEKVEVRRLRDHFLHGKAFITYAPDDGVIAGSANFTYAGLSKNLELVLGNYSPHVVERVRTWFDDLWQEAETFDLAALYEARFEPHSPYLIYLRMLWERYGAELALEASASGGVIHLTRFQEDGLWRAKRILAERNGVLIADEVGLGKTFIGGELIREAIVERRQRVLLVAPATLRDGVWAAFKRRFQLGVETVSYDEMADGSYAYDPGEYAMVVVDEGHNLRNPSTLRAEALRRLVSGTPPKQLVLMTATPVNNSLWDLYYLLTYFLKVDSEFASVGIQSLRDHFARAMALNPDDLSPDHLFDILDAVSVRRTRPFVKRYYPNDRIVVDGIEVPITFPKPRPISVPYQLDEAHPGFFDRFEIMMGGRTDHTDADRIERQDDGVPVLTFARYVPSRYRRGGQAEAFEVQVAGLLRSGLLKRFESSAYAFGRTCRKMVGSHDAFLNLLGQGFVATGETLGAWAATDSDDLDELQAFFDENETDLEASDIYDIEALRADVEHDRDVLLGLAEDIEKVRPEQDPKLAVLIEELCAIAEQADAEGIGEADTRDKRKVLVFSYYADTVDWIVEYLERMVESDPRLVAYRGRITAAAGSRDGKEAALFGFAPRTTEAPFGRDDDLYDLLVSTDVLAEGVNLQQARHLINYDLPWNPMRLVQRHGRIDRIGSAHDEVFLRCFMPDDRLDALLGLEQRLHRKITQAAHSVGVGAVLPGSETSDHVYAETRQEIERLRAEDPSFYEHGGDRGAALSGEEYRQELRRALEDPNLRERIEQLAWGSGSGMIRTGGERGFVFCGRVGDHPQVQFRYVATPDGEQPVVVGETLTCLAQAQPPAGADTERALDDDVLRQAFDAWALAKDDIEERWREASDPRALAPEVPRVMRDAVEIMRGHKPPELTQEQADTLVDALEQAFPERIQRLFRQVLRANTGEPMEQARAIAATVAELGLQPAPAPEPLPSITSDDIHLICWLAFVPASLA